MMDWKELIIDKLQAYIIPYSLRITSALIILILGLWLSMTVRRGVSRFLLSRKIENTVSLFLGHLSYVLVILIVAIIALGRLGVETASLIAVVSASAFAIILSLKNSLSSLSAGIILIIFRPFKVGDYIGINQVKGTVQEIQLTFTRICTPEQKMIYIPNETLLSSEIVNESQNEIRRQDIFVGIAYESDLDLAKTCLLEVLKADRRVLQGAQTPLLVAVSELAANSVVLVMRCYSTPEDSETLKFALLEAAKKRLDQAGIVLPYPRRDVHLYTHDNSPKV